MAILKEFKELVLLLWQDHKISHSGMTAAGHDTSSCPVCFKVLQMLEAFKE